MFWRRSRLDTEPRPTYDDLKKLVKISKEANDLHQKQIRLLNREVACLKIDIITLKANLERLQNDPKND